MTAARAVPAWVLVSSAILVVIGLADAAYLTLTHFSEHVRLACSDSGTINCAKVTTSPQSSMLGIPVAVLGLAYFLVAAGLCAPPAWRSPEPLVGDAGRLPGLQERDATEGDRLVAPLIAVRPARRDEPFAFVEAKRRLRDAAPRRELPDGQFSRHLT